MDRLKYAEEVRANSDLKNAKSRGEVAPQEVVQLILAGGSGTWAKVGEGHQVTDRGGVYGTGREDPW